MNNPKYEIWQKLYYRKKYNIHSFEVKCRIQDEDDEFQYADWKDIWSVFWSQIYAECELYDDVWILKQEIINELENLIEWIRNFNK